MTEITSSTPARGHELSLDALDTVNGGHDQLHGSGIGGGGGRGDGLGHMREVLGNGIIAEIATVLVNGIRGGLPG